MEGIPMDADWKRIPRHTSVSWAAGWNLKEKGIREKNSWIGNIWIREIRGRWDQRRVKKHLPFPVHVFVRKNKEPEHNSSTQEETGQLGDYKELGIASKTRGLQFLKYPPTSSVVNKTADNVWASSLQRNSWLSSIQTAGRVWNSYLFLKNIHIWKSWS